MKDSRQYSHDILNILERLRIMHDLAKDRNFAAVTKEELETDLDEAIKKLEKSFIELINIDQ